MTLTEQLAADQKALEAAESTLEEAKAAVDKDQAAMAAIAPHISLWDEVATMMNKNNLEHLFADIVARARALLGV